LKKIINSVGTKITGSVGRIIEIGLLLKEGSIVFDSYKITEKYSSSLRFAEVPSDPIIVIF